MPHILFVLNHGLMIFSNLSHGKSVKNTDNLICVDQENTIREAPAALPIAIFLICNWLRGHPNALDHPRTHRV